MVGRTGIMDVNSLLIILNGSMGLAENITTSRKTKKNKIEYIRIEQLGMLITFI